MLSILTLVVLAVTYTLERVAKASRFATYVIVLGNSLALFFHLLPALNEGGTRLPLGNPAFTGPDDPALQAWVAAGFVVYLIGAVIQAVRIHRGPLRPAGASAGTPVRCPRLRPARRRWSCPG